MPRRLLIPAFAAALLLHAAPPALRAASPDADRQFTFAARLMQQGEHQLADQAFSEFIARFGSDPRIGDAHYYLALLARQRGDLKAAEALLAAADKPLAVTQDAIHLLAGQLKLESGDPAAAVAHLEKVRGPNLPDNESRAVWAYLLATAYRAAGNLEAAARHFDAASEAESSVRGSALLELGKTRITLKQPAAAIEALTAAAAARIDPASAAEARLLAADLSYHAAQYERAVDLYRQIIQRHQTSPSFPAATLGLLRALYASGQDAALIQQHETLKPLLPASAQPEALYLVAAAHVRLEQYAQAATPLAEFTRRFGGDHPLAPQAAYLSAVVFFHSDVAGFERWFATIEKDLPRMAQRHDLQFLRAQAAVKREKPDEAVRHLAPLIEDASNPYAQRALLQRAALLEQLGRADEAAAEYARYVQLFGQDAKASEAARRAIDLAFTSQQFQKVVELAQPWLASAEAAKADAAQVSAVRFKLAVAQIKLNQLDAALANLDKVLAAKPAEPLAAFVQLYRGIVLAGRAAPASPGSPDSTAPAVEALSAAMRGPIPAEQQAEAMRLIAQLHRMAGRDDKALDTYEQLRTRLPVSSFDTLTALFVGRGLHDAGKYESALLWLTSAAARTDATPDALAESLFLAGSSYQALQQHDAAIETYRRLIGFGRGYGDQARLGLAQSLASAGQVEEALEEYQGLLTAEASRVAATALLDSALLRRDLALRLSRAGDSSAAATHLETARKDLSRVTILYDLPQLNATPLRAHLALGRISADAGDTDKARTHFQAVTQRTPETAWHSPARAELLVLSGQRGDAVFLFRKVLEQGRDPLAVDYARRRLTELGETP